MWGWGHAGKLATSGSAGGHDVDHHDGHFLKKNTNLNENLDFVLFIIQHSFTLKVSD